MPGIWGELVAAGAVVVEVGLVVVVGFCVTAPGTWTQT